MGINGQNIHVERHSKIVGDRKIGRARGDIERLIVFQLHLERKLGLRLICEIQRSGRPYLLRLARGLQMHVEHELIARVETPSEAVWLNVR